MRVQPVLRDVLVEKRVARQKGMPVQKENAQQQSAQHQRQRGPARGRAQG